MGPQNLFQIGTLRSAFIPCQPALPLSPERSRQKDRKQLKRQRRPHTPPWRIVRVVPEQCDVAQKRESHRGKDPVRNLTKVAHLHLVELCSAYQLPRSEDVDLMCPDRSNVVERKGKIQEKEYARTHHPTPPSDCKKSKRSAFHPLAFFPSDRHRLAVLAKNGPQRGHGAHGHIALPSIHPNQQSGGLSRVGYCVILPSIVIPWRL